MLKTLTLIVLAALAGGAAAQKPSKSAAEKTTPKKINSRPAAKTAEAAPTVEPFGKADVKTLAAHCVKFETEAGVIEMEMFPESAPESVRSFLNLSATGTFDTTTFSRIVPNFVIQAAICIHGRVR